MRMIPATEEVHTASTGLPALHDVQQILEDSAQGVWVLGERDDTVYVNRKALALLGRSREEMMGLTIQTVLGASNFAGWCREPGRHWECPEQNEDACIHRADGTEAWALITTNALTDREGQCRGTVVMLTDVSERRGMERRLQHAQRMETAGQVAGGIAHDFNNLLTVIECHSDLAIRQLPPGNPLVTHLLEIRKACEAATSLNRQMLAFGGRQKMEPRPLEMNGLIRGLLPIMKGLFGEAFRLECRLCSGIWPVLADAALMQQALMNLVMSTRDRLTAGGQVLIETSNEPPVVPGSPGSVALRISDNGAPISPGMQDRAFEPFAAGSQPASGRSLNLAAAYGLVRQNGGLIEALPNRGGGSVIEVRFPRLAAPDGEVRTLKHIEEPGPEAPPRQPLVLLVEDETGLRGLVRHILAKQRYRVLEAANGEEALSVLESTAEPVDLLLTDVVMPRVSGASLARILLAKNPKLRVVFMSGYPHDELSKEPDFEQLRHYLQKPFTPQMLLDKLRDALKEKAESDSI
jgi:two-component system, cell cycle sensor histidine kinase and response regulator CckA